jgi:hypothetical protein
MTPIWPSIVKVAAWYFVGPLGALSLLALVVQLS